MALGFTPAFSYAIIDNTSQLVITPDYSNYPSFTTLATHSVEISTQDNGITVTIDLLDKLVTANPAGTVTVSLAGTSVTGSGTTFTTDFLVGDSIVFTNNPTIAYEITAIASNTALTIKSKAGIAISNGTYMAYAKSAYLLASEFGWSTIKDDIYTFVYSLDFGSSVEGSFTELMAFAPKCECYVLGKVKNIPNYVLGSNCSCTYVDNVMSAWMMLESLKYTALNGSSDFYTTLKTSLTDLCEFDAFSSDTCNCNT